MPDPDSLTRRRFLKQSFAFSALAAATGGLDGCGSGIAADAAVDAPPAQHIAMVGDWGYDSTIVNQQAVSTGLQSFLTKHAINDAYMLLLGDNFYGPLTSVSDPRWQAQFENMYPASALPNTCWAVLGNHEYQTAYVGKKEVEFAYAAQKKSRWTMPNNWYRVDLPAGNPVASLYFLDSNVLPADGKIPGGFFVMDETTRLQQLAWLTEQLSQKKTTPFRIVVAHHPLYSNGPHGDNAALIRDWDPLFRKHGVDLYLAGHDHDLQHLEFAGHPTSFVSSGAGGAELYPLAIGEAQRGPFALAGYGSSFLTIAEDHLAVRHLDTTGAVIHSFRRGTDGVVQIVR